jgi:hypothetical protein
MNAQLTIDAPAQSKRDLILATLTARAGQWVGGSEFMDGRHGYRVSSYSQRIGQLIRAGHEIERDCHGDNGLGRYRLVAPIAVGDTVKVPVRMRGGKQLTTATVRGVNADSLLVAINGRASYVPTSEVTR